jgi:hypothetical protein
MMKEKKLQVDLGQNIHVLALTPKLASSRYKYGDGRMISD